MGGLRSSPTYIYRHNSSYIFRITTPFDIVPHINKKESRYSLRTGSLSVAKFRARVNKVFLVEKGSYKGRPISVRGIQKRIEYYAKKSGVKVSCHRLRHTMATQMLNADAKMVTILLFFRI